MMIIGRKWVYKRERVGYCYAGIGSKPDGARVAGYDKRGGFGWEWSDRVSRILSDDEEDE